MENVAKIMADAMAFMSEGVSGLVDLRGLLTGDRRKHFHKPLRPVDMVDKFVTVLIDCYIDVNCELFVVNLRDFCL